MNLVKMTNHTKGSTTHTKGFSYRCALVGRDAAAASRGICGFRNNESNSCGGGVGRCPLDSGLKPASNFRLEHRWILGAAPMHQLINRINK